MGTGRGTGPHYAIKHGPPPLATPGPGPQGPVSRHVREQRRRGRWDGGNCRRRTGQRGRPCRSLRAGRTGVRGSIPRRHRAGPAWSGARAGPTPSHQGPRSFDSRAGVEERSSTTPRCRMSTARTSLGTVGLFGVIGCHIHPAYGVGSRAGRDGLQGPGLQVPLALVQWTDDAAAYCPCQTST